MAEPRFRPLWYAGLFINSARWLDFLILAWVALELTGSPFLVGIAAFVRSAPMMLFGLFAGLLVDRLPRGRLLIGVQCLNLAVALALAALFASGQPRFELLLGLELLVGIGWVLDYPTRRTVVSSLVPARRLTNAISLESMSQQGTKMSGPLLGGLLLGQAGPVGSYLALAALYGLGLVFIVVLTRRTPLPAVGTGESMLAGLVTGLREVRAQPIVLGVLAVTAVMNLLIFPYQQMWSVLARDVLRIGPELLGLLVAANGLGALTGAVIIASWSRASAQLRIFLGGSLGAALLAMTLASSAWYPFSVAVQYLLGMAESSFATMQAALILLTASERARGRVMGILTVCIGTGPLGTLWIGFAASQLGAPLAIVSSASIGFLLMLPIALKLRFARPAAAAIRPG